MENYLNTGRDSGILGYDIENTYIWVYFKDGWRYLYNYETTGVAEIERMKDLARAGEGLNEYINRTIKKRFSRKERY